MPEANAAELPASEDLADGSRGVEVRFSRAERKFIDGIDGEVVADVENTRTFVALQAVHILRTVRLAAADRAVVNGMGPCIASLKFQPFLEAALQRQSKPVVRTGADIALVVD